VSKNVIFDFKLILESKSKKKKPVLSVYSHAQQFQLSPFEVVQDQIFFI
jgi:hypothetical protein